MATPTASNEAVIKVMGVGGGGSKAVNGMIKSRINGVEVWIIDTDLKVLSKSTVPPENRLQIGMELTRGLSAGGNPSIGVNAANENRQSIEMALADADMVFLIAGMGGGTGTGSAPIIAKIAKSKGIFTAGIVTIPFSFEGPKRKRQALHGIKTLRNEVDTLMMIQSDRILTDVSTTTCMTEAFGLVNAAIRQSVHGIVELVTVPSLIDSGISNVHEILTDAGSWHVGTGTAKGKTKAREAAIEAMKPKLPLLNFGKASPTGIFCNIAGGKELTESEIKAVSDVILELVERDAEVKIDVTIDPTLLDQVRVRVVATGFLTPWDN